MMYGMGETLEARVRRVGHATPIPETVNDLLFNAAKNREIGRVECHVIGPRSPGEEPGMLRRQGVRGCFWFVSSDPTGDH